MQAEHWAAAIDSVGRHTLVTACGLAPGMDLPATVTPFILRGVSPLGINRVTRPKIERMEAWARLARDLDLSQLDPITREIGLGGDHRHGARRARRQGARPRGGGRQSMTTSYIQGQCGKIKSRQKASRS